MAEYTYDAFISYRHCEKDKYVAEKLHEMLESYRLPASIRKNHEGGKTKINRVFRDKDELPLTNNLEDPIMKALSSSEYLIVICSPRLKESIWCRREIETFIQMHGRQNVLAVLIEGEPSDSFPDELLYAEEVVKHPDGTEETVKKMLEPLAADFRGETTGEIKKAMKEEILRLLAPMFSLNYDDLKRRHRERKIRRMITVAASVSAASILFGSYCAYTAMKIKKQNVIIEEQSEVLRGQKEELQVQADTLQVQADELQAQATELQAQKEQLEEQAVQLSEQNEQLEEQAVQLTEQNDSLKRHQAASLAKESGDLLHRDYRKEAIQVAYSALTEYDGAEMPVTPDAVRALTNAVGIYDGGRILKASVSVSAPGKIESLLVSPEGNYMLSYDSFQCLILWDALEMKEITRVEQVFENGFGFLGENAFYYNNDEDGLTRVDVANLEKTSYSSTRVTGNTLFGQAAACEGTRLAVRSFDGIAILDGETLEELYFYPSSMQLMDSKLLAVQGSDEICFVEKGEEADRFTVLSAETGEALFQGDAPKGSLASCIADDENVYILCYNFSDSLEGAETLTAFDRETGYVKWMRENKGMILGELHYSEGDGLKRLAVTYRAMAWLLDAETGADLRWYNIETPVRYTVTDGLGGFYFYNADGEQVSFSERSDSLVLDIKFIDCEDLMALNRTAGYFVGVPENDNRILGYGIRKNGAAEVIDGNIPDCEQQGLHMEEDIRNWCEAHNVPMDFSIRSLLELEGEDLTFTNCKDQTLKVYRTSTMEMLSSMEWKNSGILRYWGTKDDLLYIEDGAMTGMAFDREGNLWTEIPEFCGLTEDKENVIIYGRDENAANAYLTIPLYSLEGVMEKAQTLMNRE